MTPFRMSLFVFCLFVLETPALALNPCPGGTHTLPAGGLQTTQQRQLQLTPSDRRIQMIRDRFEAIGKLHSALETEQVKAQLVALGKQFPEVQKESAFTNMVAEILVIGKEAGQLQVERWFQGSAGFDDAIATLVVFWESWCPHCQDDMPRIQQFYDNYLQQGLSVIGLTRVSETATVTSVIGFIAERDLTFPIAKVDDATADHFGVVAVPAAIIVKNGRVLWRGKPELLTDQTIKRALAD